MGFYDSLCQTVEVNKQQMAIFNTRSCQDKIIWIVTHRDNIVFLCLFKPKCLNCMFNLHREKIHNENFIGKCYNNFILPNTNRLNTRLKGQISDYSLCIYQKHNKKVTVIKNGKFLRWCKWSFPKSYKCNKIASVNHLYDLQWCSKISRLFQLKRLYCINFKPLVRC